MKDLVILAIFVIVVTVIYAIRLWSYFNKGGK